MKKTVGVVLILILFAMPLILAGGKEYTTIILPFNYEQSTGIREQLLQEYEIEAPGGVSEIVSLTIELTGDWNNGDVYGIIDVNGSTEYCTPTPWDTPYQDGYNIRFDCTPPVKDYFLNTNIININGIGIEATKASENIYGEVKIIYIDKEPITINVHGTEYKAGDLGKVFIQLLDESSQAVNDSSCYASVYYPNDEVYKYQQLMTYLDEGLYDYDFDIPYTKGVYPISVMCIVDGVTYQSSIKAWDTFETGTVSGGDGWDTNWQLSGCLINENEAHTGTYSLYCRNDRDPNRRIDSNLTYVRLDYDFWYMGSGFGNGEYIYIEMQDASGIEHQLQIISNANADGSWKHATGSLSLESNNFDFDGQIRFELDTSGNIDENDKYYIDDLNITLGTEISINNTEYQIIRGSGEVHISSDKEYIAELIMGQKTNDTFDNKFIFNYDIISQTSQNKSDQKIELPLWAPFPCDHMLGVYEKLLNGTRREVNYFCKLSENSIEGAIIEISEDLDVGKTYNYEIDAENNWKQHIWNDYNQQILEEEMLNISCNNYKIANNLSDWIIPINKILNDSDGDALWRSCNSYFSTSAHMKTVLEPFFQLSETEANFTEEEMEALNSQWKHYETTKDILKAQANAIMNGMNLAGTYSVALINDPTPPTNPLYATYFSSISSSYLNFQYLYGIATQAIQVNATAEVDVDSTEIANAVWNYNDIPSSTLLGNISNSIWSYADRQLTAFAFSIGVNETAIANAVWAAATRTLSSFNFAVSAEVNATQVADEVWNESRAKYTHGIVLD